MQDRHQESAVYPALSGYTHPVGWLTPEDICIRRKSICKPDLFLDSTALSFGTGVVPLLRDILVRIPLIGLDGYDGREGWGEQPTPPVAANPKAGPRVERLKVTTVHASLVAWGPGLGSGGEQGLLHLFILLDKLAGDNAEDLLDALATFGTDLVTGVPAYLLPPEAGATFGAGTARLARGGAGGGQRAGLARVVGEERGETGGGGRRGGAEAWCEVLSNVGDATLKGYLAFGGVTSNDVGFGTDDMEDNVVGEVLTKLVEPYAHFGKGLGVGYGVTENAGIGSTVVKSGDGAEPLLSGGIPDLEADSGIGVAIDNLFGHETSTDSGGGLSRVELALAVAGDEGCFANPLGAENDDLGLEGRHDFR